MPTAINGGKSMTNIILCCCVCNETIIAAIITGVFTLLSLILSVCVALRKRAKDHDEYLMQKKQMLMENIYAKLIANLDLVIRQYKLYAQMPTSEEKEDNNWLILQQKILEPIKESQIQIALAELYFKDDADIIQSIKDVEDAFINDIKICNGPNRDNAKCEDYEEKKKILKEHILCYFNKQQTKKSI